MEELKTTVDPIVTPVVPAEPPVSPEPVVPAEGDPQPAAVVEYDLPDGTKANAEDLSKAWRDKFMPDYTRKSQELAALKAKLEPVKEPVVTKDEPWTDPEWAPETYQELATQIKEKSIIEAEQRVWQKILDESTRSEREAEERDAYLKQEIEQLKALDPKVDVNQVMVHASKYAFPSLIPAFQNMKAFEDAERRVEERVIKNFQTRAGSPVGIGGAAGTQVSFPADVKTGLDKARYILRNQK